MMHGRRGNARPFSASRRSRQRACKAMPFARPPRICAKPEISFHSACRATASSASWDRFVGDSVPFNKCENSPSAPQPCRIGRGTSSPMRTLRTCFFSGGFEGDGFAR